MLSKLLIRFFTIAVIIGVTPVFLATAEEAVIEIGIVNENGVRHVTAKEAAQLIEKKPEIIVLDVRTAGEFQRGHIEDAVNVRYLPFGFKKRIKDLDPDATYLVHCKSGHRSNRSVSIMLKENFKNLIHLDGGIDAWKDAKLPTVSEK